MTSVCDFLSADRKRVTATVTGFLPRTAFIPLNYEGDDTFDILISEGEKIEEGQTISKNKNNSIHSSISGVVSKISDNCVFFGKKNVKLAKIDLGGSFSYVGHKQTKKDWRVFDEETLRFKLGERGAVNTFSGCESLFDQIRFCEKKIGERILAVRLFDEDPSRITEKMLTSIFFDKIIVGAKIIAKALKAEGIVFVYDNSIEKHKNQIQSKVELAKNEVYTQIEQTESESQVEEIETESSESENTNENIVFSGTDARFYPCGFKHEIAQIVKKDHRNTIFEKIGSKDLFIDSQTAIRAFDSVVYSLPVMNTFVHVTGECLNASGVINVKIGTTLADLAFHCGGFRKRPSKIVINGIATGNSAGNLEIPVTSAIKSVEFISKRHVPNQTPEKCVRCGACANVCPVHIYPESLYRIFVNKNAEISEEESELSRAALNTAFLCTGCAMCNTVCPSRIPLCQIIESLKETLE